MEFVQPHAAGTQTQPSSGDGVWRKTGEFEGGGAANQTTADAQTETRVQR